MKRLKHRHLRTAVACLLALAFVSLAACGGNTELTAERGYDPTPTPTPQ